MSRYLPLANANQIGNRRRREQARALPHDHAWRQRPTTPAGTAPASSPRRRSVHAASHGVATRTSKTALDRPAAARRPTSWRSPIQTGSSPARPAPPCRRASRGCGTSRTRCCRRRRGRGRRTTYRANGIVPSVREGHAMPLVPGGIAHHLHRDDRAVVIDRHLEHVTAGRDPVGFGLQVRGIEGALGRERSQLVEVPGRLPRRVIDRIALVEDALGQRVVIVARDVLRGCSQAWPAGARSRAAAPRSRTRESRRRDCEAAPADTRIAAAAMANAARRSRRFTRASSHGGFAGRERFSGPASAPPDPATCTSPPSSRCASIASASAFPFLVSEYSTRTGVSGRSRCARPAPPPSSSCRRSLSMRSVMSGMASRSVANRQVCLSSRKMIAPVQRRPISSLAWWNRVQSCGACLARRSWLTPSG